MGGLGGIEGILEDVDAQFGFLNMEMSKKVLDKLKVLARKNGYPSRAEYVRKILYSIANEEDDIVFSMKIREQAPNLATPKNGRIPPRRP